MNNEFSKYKNPDKRCSYPFDPMPVGYCWGYANFVDKGQEYLDFESSKYPNQPNATCMADYCSGRMSGRGKCEFWEDKDGESK